MRGGIEVTDPDSRNNRYRRRTGVTFGNGCASAATLCQALKVVSLKNMTEQPEHAKKLVS